MESDVAYGLMSYRSLAGVPRILIVSRQGLADARDEVWFDVCAALSTCETAKSIWGSCSVGETTFSGLL